MQLEKIVSEKHDIKNKISTLEKLIENGSYNDAVNLCRETTDSLKSAYSPIYSDNPILNAIVNVELEKAANSKIDFSVDIANTLKFLSSADTVSLIGNLCDNAIEYLNRNNFEKKQINLKIRTHLSFCIITCKNTTDGNVLKENPNLTTVKKDETNHGKGLAILRKMVKEYDGDLVIKEHDDSISISAILRMP
ncbi:MAG: GHKL domain-containing protein [Clostridia bacterium]|nr:GHKL domain-containing protein [Clostridia bacterium]